MIVKQPRKFAGFTIKKRLGSPLKSFYPLDVIEYENLPTGKIYAEWWKN